MNPLDTRMGFRKSVEASEPEVEARPVGTPLEVLAEHYDTRERQMARAVGVEMDPPSRITLALHGVKSVTMPAAYAMSMLDRTIASAEKGERVDDESTAGTRRVLAHLDRSWDWLPVRSELRGLSLDTIEKFDVDLDHLRGRMDAALKVSDGAPTLHADLAALAARIDAWREVPVAGPVQRVTLADGKEIFVSQADLTDIPGILEIQKRYQLAHLDASDHPENGWLVQMTSEAQLRFAMQAFKDYWVAKDGDGTIIAYQAITAPSFISRPPEKHRYFGPRAEEAEAILRGGQFLYMSQIAAHPDHRAKGLAAALQNAALENYDPAMPLLAHAAVFTQSDFDRWDGAAPFEAHNNNIASHKFHLKLDYEPVAWTSDIARTTQFNSGFPTNDDDTDGICGVLYLAFRDGRPVDRDVDPLALVMDHPADTASLSYEAWQNPFPAGWPDFELMRASALEYDIGFLPNPTGLAEHEREINARELDRYRR
ncbi:MAG: hypothetical protein RMA76_01985 [Deltaproteobacteria bacterium]